jgi:hypothetical protein
MSLRGTYKKNGRFLMALRECESFRKGIGCRTHTDIKNRCFLTVLMESAWYRILGIAFRHTFLDLYPYNLRLVC